MEVEILRIPTNILSVTLPGHPISPTGGGTLGPDKVGVGPRVGNGLRAGWRGISPFSKGKDIIARHGSSQYCD